jgi:RNA polymerase sigma-70 factor, ECF subfamily
MQGGGGRQPARATVTGTELAAEVKRLLGADDQDLARDRYGALVTAYQRRASRLAFYYLRDAAEADEAVQDAFVKAYSHLPGYNEASPFDVWFFRILVNGCLDRVKARGRRARWQVPFPERREWEGSRAWEPAAVGPSPEERLLRDESAATLRQAIDALPARQRTVVLLSHLDGRTNREVSEITGMAESTVRVHMFRALRRLRLLLTGAAATRPSDQ